VNPRANIASLGSSRLSRVNDTGSARRARTSIRARRGRRHELLLPCVLDELFQDAPHRSGRDASRRRSSSRSSAAPAFASTPRGRSGAALSLWIRRIVSADFPRARIRRRNQSVRFERVRVCAAPKATIDGTHNAAGPHTWTRSDSARRACPSARRRSAGNANIEETRWTSSPVGCVIDRGHTSTTVATRWPGWLSTRQ
jgi:hypothetical protein